MNTLQQSFADFVAYRRRRLTGPNGDGSLGQLRAVVPIARAYGFDRGKPVDRFFIERYMAANAAAVQGRVLAIGHGSKSLE
jgi:hypothetical protein